MYQKWKGKFPAMVYGVILLIIFLFNCIAVVGVDTALRFPYKTRDAALESMGDLEILDVYTGYSRWDMAAYLAKEDDRMILTGVEKHFLLNCYRLLPCQTVTEGQHCSLWASRGKMAMTITNGQLEIITLMPLEMRLIPNTQIYVPHTIFFICIGLMLLELILALVFHKLRGN